MLTKMRLRLSDLIIWAILSRDPIEIKYLGLYLEILIWWEVITFKTDSEAASLWNSSLSNSIVSFFLNENIVKTSVRKEFSWF